MPVTLVVIGASGAGKTTAITELRARGLSGVRCFHFDDIGVPSPEVMDAEFGGGEAWQAWATKQWMDEIEQLSADVHVAELANDRMAAWAEYLREQARVLELPVIDTRLLSVGEVADRLEALVTSR